jgi:hypothetical protein
MFSVFVLVVLALLRMPTPREPLENMRSLTGQGNCHTRKSSVITVAVPKEFLRSFASKRFIDSLEDHLCAVDY